MRADAVRLVMLDMGGVLLPEFSAYERAAGDLALIDALRARGVAEPERLIERSARGVREAYAALNAQCTQPDLEAVLSGCDPIVRRLLLRAFAQVADRRPYAFTGPVLARLAQRYRLALVSNTIIPGDHHRRTLERFGLLRWLEHAVWSANFGIRKPDPAMIHHVLDALGIRARNAVFVGDKLRTDVEAARRAHVRAIHLRRGATAVGSARADFVIRDLRELPILLARLP